MQNSRLTCHFSEGFMIEMNFLSEWNGCSGQYKNFGSL